MIQHFQHRQIRLSAPIKKRHQTILSPNHPVADVATMSNLTTAVEALSPSSLPTPLHKPQAKSTAAVLIPVHYPNHIS